MHVGVIILHADVCVCVCHGNSWPVYAFVSMHAEGLDPRGCGLPEILTVSVWKTGWRLMADLLPKA